MASVNPALHNALVRVSAANAVLRLRLEENDGLVGQAISMNDSGSTAREILDALPIQQSMQAADDALMSLVEARDHLRTVTVHAALTSGMDADELAERFEVPREVIDSFAKRRPAGLQDF